jgi:hypothetical protein
MYRVRAPRQVISRKLTFTWRDRRNQLLFAGVSAGCMLPGAALIVIGVAAALALNRGRRRATVTLPVSGHMREPVRPATSRARTRLIS